MGKASQISEPTNRPQMTPPPPKLMSAYGGGGCFFSSPFISFSFLCQLVASILSVLEGHHTHSSIEHALLEQVHHRSAEHSDDCSVQFNIDQTSHFLWPFAASQIRGE